MTALNRHIRGETNDIFGDVRGNVTVEAGDFIFRNDKIDGLRGTSLLLDAYVYPFNLCVNASSSQATLMDRIRIDFVGIAMESSLADVTESITIATSGIFSYPLSNATGSGVTVGSLVSAVSPSATGTGVSVQAVVNTTTQPGSTAYLGRCTKTESGASYVEFAISTVIGGVTVPGA